MSHKSAHDRSFLRVSIERDEARAKLAEAIEVLEFYASAENWDWPINGTEENSMIKFDDCGPVEGLCDTRGGKRARALLEKLRDE
jgi:hypothetical protein